MFDSKASRSNKPSDWNRNNSVERKGLIAVKRLYKSRTDRKIFGVCGGIAEYFNIDPTIVRLITVILVFGFGMGVLAYLVAALIMSDEP